MKSDNEDDVNSDSDSEDSNGKSCRKVEEENGDFLIREKPANESKNVGEKEDESIRSKDKVSHLDEQKEEENPTIELKISLGDFGGSPVMDLLGGAGNDDKDGDDDQPRLSGEEPDDDEHEMSKKETLASNLLLRGKRKRADQKPKGPLITELS